MTTPTDAPAVPGLVIRTFRDPSDYAAMADLEREANLHDGEDFLPDAESLRAEYEHTTDLDPRLDIFFAEVDGRVVASSSVNRQVRDGLAVYGTKGVVLPAWRRRGIGRALLRTGEARLRQLAERFDDRDGRVLGSWASDREGGARELLHAEGYTAVRYGFSMRRPHLDDIPGAPLPDGLELRPVTETTLRTVFDADNEAFRDHWGHREANDDDFAEMRAMPDFDPSLWSVAWDGDEVAGVVMTWVWRSENEALGVRRGWLEHISVRRPWRRRGLARALIADALRRLREAGIDEAMLGVDAENPLGAMGLYESVGFEVRNRGATYRKPWEPGGRLV